MAQETLREPHGREERRDRAGFRHGGRSGTRRLARGLFLISLVVGAVPVAFAISGHDSGSDFLTALPVFVMAYSGVGALIAMRLPSNAIGWLFLSIGLVAAIEPATIAYLTHPSLLPGRQWAAWTSQWVVVFGFGLVPFLLLLFPNGRLVSRRWRTACG